MFKFDNGASERTTYITKLEAGECDFVVLEAKDADEHGNPLVSKKGNPMIKLKLLVRDGNNIQENVNDWIVSSFPSKIMDFCKAIGREDLWEHGVLKVQDLVHCDGRCNIMHNHAINMNIYANVSDYIPRAIVNHKLKARHQSEPQEKFDDEIPF